jgi:Transposase DDE domain
MAKPSDPAYVSESTDPTLIGRLARLCCWPSGELAGQAEGRHQGPRQKLLDWQIVAGLVAQCLHASGCLQHIIRRYFAVQLSSSALSQRRQHMQLKPFITVMRHALRPMALPQSHADCFFAGLRLVGIDGTQFNLLNTPQINAVVPKVSTRRGEAAFGKLSLSVLVELGTHAPLAAAMQTGPMSEKVLCQQLWEGLPRESLLILDRYYGQAPMLGQLQPQCEARGSHFLVRVRDKLNVKVQQPHADGSATVVVTLREPAAATQPADELVAKPARTRGRPRKHAASKVSELKVREVRGRVLRHSDHKWVEVRLWTSLSPQQASAGQLLELYARRWEQEIFYKELKLQLNQGDLLGGQRTETAAQQVAAMMIACSLLAEERLAIAESCEDEEVRRAGAVRISFSLCQEYTAALFMVLQASQGLMDSPAQAELVRRVRAQLAAAALPPRRSRSCQRKIRRPIDKWPRMLAPTSLPSSKLFAVSPIT